MMTQHTINPKATKAIKCLSNDGAIGATGSVPSGAQPSGSLLKKRFFICCRRSMLASVSKSWPRNGQGCRANTSHHITWICIFFNTKKVLVTGVYTFLSDYFNKVKTKCWAFVLAWASHFLIIVFIQRNFTQSQRDKRQTCMVSQKHISGATLTIRQ